MAESQEAHLQNKENSFEVKFKERGKKTPKIYYRDQYYRNQIKATKDAGLPLNPELRKNFKKIAVEFGDITGEKEETSDIDPLTKILNRRGFGKALEAWIDESKRFNYPLTLASFDIDNFKILNDELGHPVGDEILVSIAQLIQNDKRKIDVWGRIGGDEFNLLLPSTNFRSAKTIMARTGEKIKEMIKNNFDVFNLGVSYGIYQWDGKEDIKDFLRKTDNKLYEAKEQNHG